MISDRRAHPAFDLLKIVHRKVFWAGLSVNLPQIGYAMKTSVRDADSDAAVELFRGEADLRMSFELGGKPCGPAFGCADANKIDV